MNIEIRNAEISDYVVTSIGTATQYINVPRQVIKEFLYGRITLTTDATVATRYINMSILDEDGDEVYRMGYHNGTAASTTGSLDIGPVYCANNASNRLDIYPPLVIPSEYAIKIWIADGQAGDSYTVRLVMAGYQLAGKDDKSLSRRRT